MVKSHGEGRLARGTRLTGEAFDIIKGDRGLLSLMAVAVVIDLFIAGAFLGLASVVAGDLHRRVVLLATLATASYPMTVVATFLNVALLNTVSRRWNGESAGVRDGLALARRRWRAILAWSLLAATLGTVLGYATYGTDPASAVVLIAVGLVAVVPVVVYANATTAVFTLAVYRYAQEADFAGPFSETDLANPFVGGGGGGIRRVRGWLGRARKRGSRS